MNELSEAIRHINTNLKIYEEKAHNANNNRISNLSSIHNNEYSNRRMCDLCVYCVVWLKLTKIVIKGNEISF